MITLTLISSERYTYAMTIINVNSCVELRWKLTMKESKGITNYNHACYIVMSNFYISRDAVITATRNRLADYYEIMIGVIIIFCSGI